MNLKYLQACLYAEEGAYLDINDRPPRSHGDTALHRAVRKGNKLLADLLLDWKADRNATNKKGLTPEQLAWEENDMHLYLSLK